MIKSILTIIVLCIVMSSIYGQVIKSAMINACKTEGLNEYLIIKNGNSSFFASASTIDIRYGTSSPASTAITDQFLVNGDSIYIGALNAKLSSGCDFKFINVLSSTSIAPDSFIIVMHKYPDDTSNFSAWCGNGIGDVYVVFADDASWGNAGIFANDTRSVTRYLRSTINGVSFDYNYGGLNLNSDGGYVTWNDTAGTFSGSGTFSNCIPTNLQSLPVSLLHFKVKTENRNTILTWATASEINNDYFIIEAYHPKDNHWETITTIKGFIHKQSISTYEYLIPRYMNMANRFRLSQYDIDGRQTILGIASNQLSKENLTILGSNKQSLFISSDNQEIPVIINCYNLNGSILSSQEINSFDSFITFPFPISTNGFLIILIQQDDRQIIHKHYQQF